MSETTKLLLFFGGWWGLALAAWLWIRWRLKKDAEQERKAREAWAKVAPRPGCQRNIPGCICARDGLGDQCVWRTPPAGAGGAL